ncbi:hypothetical protein K1719_014823 [Acacia pycnantha]|nr:hypothetical protein K1719_014823 [Acacia pycnantha]
MINAMGWRWWWVILVLLLLAPFIASSRSIIKNLPGFSGDLPFKLESGYIGVGEEEEVQLFYLFVESQRNPSKDPILLWFLGGPGCSALSAFFLENGPVTFDRNSRGILPKLILNPYAWTQVLNVIYIDLPVGTGFSYSQTQQGYHSSDILWIENSYDFLQKGFVLASPVTDKFLDRNSKVEYAHRLSLISDELYESIKASCNGNYVNINPDNKKCVSDYEAYSQLIQYINGKQILEPLCYTIPNDNRRILFEDLSDGTLQNDSTFWCRGYDYMLVEQWANNEDVRQALQIREGTKGEFLRCNKSLSYKYNLQSVVDYHHNLIDTNLQFLVFCADLDLAIPHIGTQAWIKSLNLKIKDPWRAWFVDGQVAGYTQLYKNNDYFLTYVAVKGAGHVAQQYKPKEVFQVIERWFSYAPI